MTIIRFRSESALLSAFKSVDPFQVLGRPCFVRNGFMQTQVWA